MIITITLFKLKFIFSKQSSKKSKKESGTKFVLLSPSRN